MRGLQIGDWWNDIDFIAFNVLLFIAAFFLHVTNEKQHLSYLTIFFCTELLAMTVTGNKVSSVDIFLGDYQVWFLNKHVL